MHLGDQEPSGGAAPGEVLSALIGIAGGERGAAWASFDADGRVVAVGGALAPHGLERLAPGDALVHAALWLEGLPVPPPRRMVLPALAVARHHVDVHLWPTSSSAEGPVAGPVAGYMVVVDSTLRVRERATVLERLNEANLLQEQLAGAERGRNSARLERSEALGALGVEVLERGGDGLFRPQGAPSEWLAAVCGWEGALDRVISGEDPLSFLGAFLAEAEETLDGDSPALLRSGMWSQVIAGREEVFEAFAMVLSTGRRIVMVERLDLRYRERQELLQRAREASLSHEAARRGVEHKDVLLHCIVHDLRAPLASIAGALRLLRGSGEGAARPAVAADQARELLDIALRQADRQDALIRAVLEVFHAEVMDLERFDDDPRSAPDLVEVALDGVERARPAFLERGVRLVLGAGAPAAAPVVGARDRLARVLDNLLQNALRHSPQGEAVEVSVAAGPDGPALLVSDRGAGVPEGLQGLLFRRFVRGTAGGAAGLGLYYCRMTVERWGGSITYRDRDGGGAQFHVQLRAARAVSSAPPAPGA
ncbi:MAG: ATP-binding protein [Planctomycetota bacterium]